MAVPLSPPSAFAREATRTATQLRPVVDRLVDESRLRAALTEDLLTARRTRQPAPPADPPPVPPSVASST